MPLLELREVRKVFGDTVVLADVSFTVARSEVIAIIGASGSGKSTLLRCINVLEPPTSGDLVFDGHRINYAGRERNLTRLRAEIGMVFQSYNLWPHKTVLENVIEAPIIVKREARAAVVERARHLLASIGLDDKRKEYPSRLSGGQQQRVAIVRALAMDPKLMLFDEVTSALDPELVGEVLEVMASLAQKGMTMLVVTHEIPFAREVSSRTLFMDKGRIEAIGPSSKLLVSPQNDRLRRFLKRVLHETDGGSS